MYNILQDKNPDQLNPRKVKEALHIDIRTRY